MEITITFTHSPIVTPPLALPSREIGAAVEFHGLVRELEDGRALPGLHYTAYEPMAERQLARILAELHTADSCDAVHFIHRLGWVPVGDASLYFRVLAAHRGPALRFLAAAIDRMKADVPIWKSDKPDTAGAGD